MHVFTEDLEQLIGDLEAADDKAAVVKRYKAAFLAKREVRREISSHFGSVVLKDLVVRAGTRKAGENGGSGQHSHT